MTDEYWYPLYEAMVDLEVPAMVHVSTSCNPNFHTLGAHYLNADTSVFMQFVLADLFERFPTLTFVIPHGGGAVPYHWGRYRGLAARMGRPDPGELLRNVFFDTCVYHQPGIDLLYKVIGADNLLFASEMLGAVRGADPQTGVAWDDTLVYINNLGLTERRASRGRRGQRPPGVPAAGPAAGRRRKDDRCRACISRSPAVTTTGHAPSRTAACALTVST